ncbi:MAG: tetratricopeptide repeat protein [Magnetococcales bacterium]|nr:tetratricopeptide repeat protein [Magnetococcales bacterium]
MSLGMDLFSGDARRRLHGPLLGALLLLGGILGPGASFAGEAAPALAKEEVRLAKEAVAKNELAVALDHFVKAIELVPDHLDYLHSAAMLSRQLGRGEQALTLFLKVVGLAGAAGKQADVAVYNDAILQLRDVMPDKVNDKITQTSAFPADKAKSAQAWSELTQESAALMAKGNAAVAIQKGAKALEVAKGEFGDKHYAVFVSLRDLALLHYQNGAVAEANSGLEQSVALGTEILGADHPDTLKVKSLQADLLEAGHQLAKADELRKVIVAGWETAVGPDHPSSLSAGLARARLLLNIGNLDVAQKWLEGACGKFEKNLGPYHPQLAECLNLHAVVRGRAGDLKGALALYEQVAKIHKAAFVPGDPVVLTARIEAAELIRRDGRFNEARKELEEIIALAQKGSVTSAVLDAKGALALVFEDSGEYDKAEPLLIEVLAGEKTHLGADHPNYLATQNKLAGVYRRQGKLAEAEKGYAEVLDGYRKLLGTEHQASINVMNNLGLVLENEGLYDEAEPLLRAALKSSQKLVGEDNPETLATLNNLALLHESQGNFDKAEPLYQTAIAISTKNMGEKHADSIAFVNNLAYLYLLQQNYKDAAPLFEKVLNQWTETYGEAHQRTLKAMNNLARVRHKLGAKDVAEKLFKKALAMRKSVLGERHMDVMRSMHDLGLLYLEMERLGDAEELLKKALELDEQELGKQHPYTFEALHTLADVMEAKKDKKSLQEAFVLRQEGFKRRTEFLNRMLWATGDNAREGYVRLHRGELNTFLSQVTRLEPSVGGRELLEIGLQRKGLLLKVTSEMRQVVQMAKNPQLEVIGRRLTAARKKLAALTLSGPTPETQANHLRVIHDLEESVDRLQLELGRVSKRFRRSVTPLTVEQLLVNLPDGAVLVDFMVYSERGKNRLVAGVMRNEGGKAVFSMVPYWTEMDEIQKLIVNYRSVIQQENVDPEELSKAGQETYDVIWAPLKKVLGGKSIIYVVPDGMLNILPFNALIDEEGTYLSKSLDLHFLTSSRDLLPSETPTATGGLLILAGPDYDTDKVVDRQAIQEIVGKRSASAEVREGLRAFSQGMRGLHFDPLPGAEKEGKLIIHQAEDKKKENQIYSQLDAQEKVVQSIQNPPEILHIATHGFFLKPDDSLRKRLLKMQRGGEMKLPPPGDNPLLRAGLAFAGINSNASFLGEIDTRNDGVLTALEVLSIDLTGTKLAVLSACETGLGEVHEGEGVYGLRRSFQEAGAESVIASLWEVSDAGTQALMTGLYQRLMAGKTPHEALRESRLELMDSQEWADPYIWSAFMLVGK